MTSTALVQLMPALLTVMLLSIRLGAVLLMTPVLSTLPAMVRVGVVVALSVALAVGFPQWNVPGALAFGDLVVAALTELALGATMGLGVQLAFAAFDIAGRLLDVQVGFGIAQVYDPVSRRQMPILTAALTQLAILIFFTGNFHHTLFRGLAYSLERIPPGRMWSLAGAAEPVLGHVAALFSLGFALVAPVVFCMLLLEFALATLSRSLPQLQIFALSHPLKILTGVPALALWLLGAGAASAGVYASIFHSWEALFLHV